MQANEALYQIATAARSLETREDLDKAWDIIKQRHDTLLAQKPPSSTQDNPSSLWIPDTARKF